MPERFLDLVTRHQVDPGHLVHVGTVNGPEISAYRLAGFDHVTVVNADPDQARALQGRFPWVDAQRMVCTLAETRGDDTIEVRRLDAIAPSANVAVINSLGHERAILASAPWDSLDLLIVGTCTANEPSMYDLVTEIVTTRGFVEVDRWTRDASNHDVAYIKGTRL